jgi:hypothetical protein
MIGTIPQPKVGIEQLLSVGDTCQLQMKKMGYRRFHHFHRYDSRVVSEKSSNKDGWYSTSWSRPMLIDGFVHSVKHGWYQINSPWTVNECRHFEVHYTASGKEKKEHASDQNDDGLFAAAIATFIMHDMEPMTDRAKRRPEAFNEKPQLSVEIGPWEGNKVSTKHSPVVTLDQLRYNPDSLERYRF